MENQTGLAPAEGSSLPALSRCPGRPRSPQPRGTSSPEQGDIFSKLKSLCVVGKRFGKAISTKPLWLQSGKHRGVWSGRLMST